MIERPVRMLVIPDSESAESTAQLQEKVRRRAYELYEARGREDGYDLEDWLRAESEVTWWQAKSEAA
jgi:hypothetical protein